MKTQKITGLTLRNGLFFFFLISTSVLGLTTKVFAQQLYINEFLAINAQINKDSDYSEYVDWIEIYNDSDKSVNIGDYYLTDNLDKPKKWPIPTDTIIAPKGFILFWADDKDENAHTNFKLSSSGEEIGLFDVQGILIDSITFEKQTTDISYGRKPDGGSDWYFFNAPTPGTPNNTRPYQYLSSEPPQFSLLGGFYHGSQSVVLSTTSPSAIIHYTLDGSEPSAVSTVYTTPLTVDSTMVIRARTFGVDSLPSATVTQTFFIDENVTLPVVSIATNPDNLWDEDNGIYVQGSNFVPAEIKTTANYYQDWEKPVNLAFYDLDGKLGFSLDAGIKIYGGYSRNFAQRSLAIYARSQYGFSNIKYQLFPDKPIKTFKTFILRNSGNDWLYTLFRDAMMQTLIREMDIDYQAYQPALLFINGEYWGIHNIREKVNEHYVESNHEVNSDKVDLLFLNRRIEGYVEVKEGERTHYDTLINFLESHDLNLTENYNEVKTRMDISEYINYQLSQIYFANTDWPANNVKLWRAQTQKGKWRWIVYDTDAGFGLPSGRNKEGYAFNALERVTSAENILSNDPPWSTLIFRTLLENKEFQQIFLQRFASHLNITFAPERVLLTINNLKAGIEAEIPRHIERWRDRDSVNKPFASMSEWENNIEVVREFARHRPTYVRQHIMDKFGLSETRVSFKVSEAESGSIEANEVIIPKNPFTGNYFKEVPLKLKAIPKVGYQFVKWQGIDVETSAETSDSIAIMLPDDATTITAIFAEKTSNSVFNLNTGILRIKAVEVSDKPGHITIFQAKLVQTEAEPQFVFTLKELHLVQTSFSDNNAIYDLTTNNVTIPTVAVTSQNDQIRKYTAVMTLIPESEPLAFVVTQVGQID